MWRLTVSKFLLLYHLVLSSCSTVTDTEETTENITDEGLVKFIEAVV